MGVIAHARALVSNDSGALMLRLRSVLVIAIYGPTSEKYSRPLTSSPVPTSGS